MSINSLLRIPLVLSFMIFSFFISTQFAYATPSVVPCFRYGFNEMYSVDQTSLPEGVSFQSVPLKIGFINKSFLKNSSPNPFVIDFDQDHYDKIKLVDGGVYRQINDGDWYGETEYFSSLYALVHINKEIPNANLYNSNEKPMSLDPIRFSIVAKYNDRPTTITGTVSYVLTERDCATQNTVAPRAKSFWTVVLEFLASLKFW